MPEPAPLPERRPEPDIGSGGPWWRPWLRSITRGSLGVALGFGFAVALAVSPMFVTSFGELLARTLFIAFVLLLAFVAVQQLPDRRLPRWMPRWAVSLVAIAVAAPLATMIVYVVSVRGDVAELFGNEARLRGLLIISVIALCLGMLIALGAQLRQREAESRAQALRFELERSRLERQAVDAQLSLLQAQIQPHFLFNTLANVQALVESGSPRASAVLKSLIDYLRASMPRLQGGPVTLGDEAQLVRAYLQLMQMRMPDRLDWHVGIEPEALARPFPALALLTLVENAVHHGIDPSVQGGQIEVGGRLEPGTLRLWVQDSGVGLNPMSQPGTGLRNLRARLAALHGPAASVTLSEVSPHGVRCEIVLPVS
ncbi:MAG: histidine kinase [Rubrivivax sp.]|nr:histidine kinase [Rubrivivax sp.]